MVERMTAARQAGGGVSALVWLRRDLRVHDHPALLAGLEDGGVVVVFCLDSRLLAGRHRSGTRAQFLLECLAEVDRTLRERGSGLVLRQGRPEMELPRLARELHVRRVHVTGDVGPFARRRDARVAGELERLGIALRSHPGSFVLEDPGEPVTVSGGPFSMFTPYFRSWLQVARREVLGPPTMLPPIPAGLDVGRLPRLHDLGLASEVADPAPGGEGVARERLARFLAEGVHEYDRARDDLGRAGTSGLSPYLHFGCVSPREIEARLPDGEGPAAFRRQLGWRDFYGQILWHNPSNTRSEHQARYRGRIRWSRSKRNFEAWCAGRTGYPLVDAAMRQLRREGWLPNRARLVAGSFLTKDLGIDWRWGERWFMRLLVDGDESNNNGNWQWIASVGADPEPVFKRMFNPARQQARFDPDGVYIRRHVPELRAVPLRYLAEPWRMPEDVQAQAGCTIGVDYPPPIADHRQARRAALARYAAATSAV